MGPTSNSIHRLLAVSFLAWLAFVGIAWPAPMPEPTPTTIPSGPAERLRLDAEGFERLGQWERAADLWSRLAQVDRQQPHARERLVYCLRHVHLARRHRDPSYRYAVSKLDEKESLKLYEEVLFRLNRHYVDRDKSAVSRLFRAGVEEIIIALEDATFQHEYLPENQTETISRVVQRYKDNWLNMPSDDTKAARTSANTIATLLAGKFKPHLTVNVILLEMACGACNTLDEYSAFLPPTRAGDDFVSVAGELAGLGLTLSLKGEHLIIERVLIGSWAAQAGLSRGDRVVRLGRRLPERVTAELAGELLRGEPVGNGFRLEVIPADGGTARGVDVPARAPSVSGVELLSVDHGIGYVRVASFQKNTTLELESAVMSLKGQGMRALIVDLRGNPGGLFTVAKDFAERFLPAGVIVTTQGQNPAYTQTWSAVGGMSTYDMPVVLLVDGETASAAEVVAGAFKDSGRASVVGQSTYGKGSIQCVMQLSAVGGVRLTLARFYTPSGRPVSGVGVTPDIIEAGPAEQLKVAEAEAARLLSMMVMRP